MSEKIQAGLKAVTGAAVPLLGVTVSGTVAGDRAQLTVSQRYRNDEPKPIEAVYTFPLPSDATLVGFAMTCAGRRLDGVVKEREEAFRTYDDALMAGHGAALVDQERANVFTASVGNLLPGEETLVEVTYLQRLAADEGALRLMVPTLVAPRYIPGVPGGDRTAHGVAAPTDVVPDADRISPPIGAARYPLALDVLFDLGRVVAVESPSHAIVTAAEGAERVRVRLARTDVALDRDLVLIARGVREAMLAGATAHRPAGGEPGTIALTVVPDLGGVAPPRHDVVFVIDVSGSMEGASLTEARAALRLCLRHLREGDRFNVIAFNTRPMSYEPGLVPFTQKTLEAADGWVQALRADGGTEMLDPLLGAVRQAPDGVVVLLTDGQVGNEDQILSEVLGRRGSARFYAFGIGTNVSDALLRELARRTGGAVEWIHPGERIDEKVVAQFARATAARVTDLKLVWDGVEVSELAPEELPALVDGEPWAVYGRVKGLGSGVAELRGKLAGEPWHVAVPIEAGVAERPMLAKLWAAERVRELEGWQLTGRHAGRMKERIVQIAVAHGIASRYTSFVVVEERAGDRKAGGFPETRVVPVNVPAGWAMFDEPEAAGRHVTRAGVAMPVMMSAPMMPAPPPMPGRPPAPMMSASGFNAPGADGSGAIKDAVGGLGRAAASLLGRAARRPKAVAEEIAAPGGGRDLLGMQLASGLWEDGKGADEASRLRTTARALLELHGDGVTTGHAQHGPQVKKAVAAVLAVIPTLAAADPLREALLLVAWLVSSGRRTRGEVEKAAALAGVSLLLDEGAAKKRAADLLR